MPRSRSSVGNVVDIEMTTTIGLSGVAESLAPSADLASVRLDSGRSARLTAAEPRAPAWLSVLNDLRSAGLPVYVEIDPETDALTEVLVPLRVTVESIRSSDDGVEVELLISHARHYLRRDNSDFEELLQTLERALANGTSLLVTETLDSNEIIDVRPLPKGQATQAALTLEREAGPSAEALAVSPRQAEQMFALTNGRTCCSTSPSSPCIPFTYPDDGCWGRAHEMCRLIINAGFQPEKIWIYGSLRVATSNHPSCKVGWGWHVAPVLRVDSGSGPQVRVIDPALFPGPVPQATWVGVQGDPAASTYLSPADVFYRDSNGGVVYDPTYAQTNQVLTTYRAKLQLRSASASGPPPFPQCIPRRPGVQWFGTLAANATGRWFTFGWPAGWHMIWTIMPLTICSGAPQLSWSVAVERADSSRATYWITVKNLTSRPIRFEGRYDVLSR